ncbi:hypothetical protein HDU79_011268, partial [Rhizoclosmatium sp. JEL0117]
MDMLYMWSRHNNLIPTTVLSNATEHEDIVSDAHETIDENEMIEILKTILDDISSSNDSRDSSYLGSDKETDSDDYEYTTVDAEDFETDEPVLDESLADGWDFSNLLKSSNYSSGKFMPFKSELEKTLVELFSKVVTFFEDTDSVMFARGWQAELIEHCLNVFDDECIIPVAQITASVPFSIISQIQFEGVADRKLKTSLTTGSQFRHIGQGLRVVNVPITLFNDDTSGNSSKKWNKFESWSFTLAGLPFKESQLQENVNFICTSKYVSAVESGTVIAMSLRTLRNGIKVYDSVLREDIIIIVEVIQVLGDNPAQSTIVSHIGHRSKYPCRMCNVRTPTTTEELLAFLQCPGDCYEHHTFERTKNLLLNTKQQLLNKVIDSKTALKSLAENGISDKFFAKFAENHFSTPSMNPFLGTKNERPYFSGAADAPVEVLHCVLLGVVKHTARATIPVNNKAAQSLKGVIE